MIRETIPSISLFLISLLQACPHFSYLAAQASYGLNQGVGLEVQQQQPPKNLCYKAQRELRKGHPWQQSAWEEGSGV